MSFELHHGDCLKLLKDIRDKSIDFILTDPPYGTISCKWDSVLPTKLMWKQLIRISKPKAAIALFGSEPFSSRLRMSFIKGYKYDLIWQKNMVGNVMLAKHGPMRTHENISIFSAYSSITKYYPQMIPRDRPMKASLGAHRSHAIHTKQRRPPKVKVYTHKYPGSVLTYKRPVANKEGEDKSQHPTQKPVKLLEWLIKTYSKSGETVLDFTMGAGSTGVAAMNLDRKFVGIELEKKYFDIARMRIEMAAGK